MSVSNPFNINGHWRIDPDNRQDRSSGPCITRQMTKAEKIKYGMTVESEGNEMKLTKANVRKLAAERMNKEEIVEQFAPEYPKMRKSLILAKVALYLSDKKSGPKKKEKPVEVGDEVFGEQKCRICGCTWYNACPGGCYWVEENLCSECVKKGESNVNEISAINSHEDHPETIVEAKETSIKEIAAKVAEDVSKAAIESAEKIKLRQAVDEMLEMVPDNINHPAHYTAGKIEVIDFIQDKLTVEEFEGFCKGVIIQYIVRSRLKGGLEDLKKAEWYLDRIIKTMETA